MLYPEDHAQAVETSGRSEPHALLVQALRDHFKLAQSLAREPRHREELIHQVRTAIKRMRASWRLLRSVLPDSIFRLENSRLRKAARSLSDHRERDIIAKTLGKFRKGRLAENEARIFADTLRVFQAHARDARSGENASWREAMPVLSDSLGCFEKLDTERWGWDEVRWALEQSYRQARKAYRKISMKSDASFHELRKRCKDLGYQLEALAPDVPGVEKFKRILGRLREKLGAAQDLAVVAKRMLQRPGDFGGNRSIVKLGASVSAKKRKLKKKSRRLGGRIFDSRAGAFLRELDLPGTHRHPLDLRKN